MSLHKLSTTKKCEGLTIAEMSIQTYISGLTEAWVAMTKWLAAVSGVRPESGMLAEVYRLALLDQRPPAPSSRTPVRRLGCDRSGISP